MNEIADVALPKCKTDLKIGRCRITASEYNTYRTVLSASLPFYIRGATPPRPDPSHPPSLIGGVIKRFGYEPPKPQPKLLRRFKRFVALWLRHKSGLKPLSEADLLTFDEWLESTDYSQCRKAELLELWTSRPNYTPTIEELSLVKSFIKDETYPEFKYPRLINSRVDMAKCFFGPCVATISDRLFKIPYFIKKVPVVDRPEVIYRRLFHPGATYMFTDYTAFEAHFTNIIMKACEYQLYKYMCNRLAIWVLLQYFLKKVLQGINKLMFKYITVHVVATRMSGEMNTSQDNGFSNLMIFIFLLDENARVKKLVVIDINGNGDVNLYEYDIFVEGDDGLAWCSHPELYPTKEQYAALGFTIKIGLTDRLNEASFCGCVYDVEEGIIVTDIKEMLCRIGWTNKQYVLAKEKTMLQLLRARSYSLCYQYNGCPVLSVLGRKLLELTEGVEVSQKFIDQMDWWEKQKLLEAMRSLPELRTPSTDTRELVERLFDVPIHRQVEWEEQIAQMTVLGPIDLVGLDVHHTWTEYYDTYSHQCYDTNPLWLLKDESSYLQRLVDAAPQAKRFVDSLGVENWQKPRP